MAASKRPAKPRKKGKPPKPKTSKPEAAARQRVVVSGIVAGKKTTAIAAEAGCTTRHVQRIAGEASTQFLVAEAMRPYRAKLSDLIEDSIRSVEEALHASKEDEADHKSRLWAVDRLGNMLEQAQGGKPQEQAPSGGPLVTWEEFVLLYQRRTSGSNNGNDENRAALSGAE